MKMRLSLMSVIFASFLFLSLGVHPAMASDAPSDDAGENQEMKASAAQGEAGAEGEEDACGRDPTAATCDVDGDKIFGKQDKCPLDAEVYEENGITPVDKLKDGCPNSVLASTSAPTGMTGQGGCSLIERRGGGYYLLMIILMSVPVFITTRKTMKRLEEEGRDRRA